MTPEEIALLAAQAAEDSDQSVTTEGGDFEYTPPAAGRTVARFIEYIELGKQPQKPFQGKPKPDCEEARFTFELTHPKNRKKIDIDGVETEVSDRISFRLPIKLTEKAWFKKLWNSMTYGRDNIKHMAQMLGEAFIVEVVHAQGGTDNKTTYANLRDKDSWKIYAPRKVDDLAGTSEDISNSVPKAIGDVRIFLWNKPTKQTWDSLFIDGTREVKDDKGNVAQESKNYWQLLITKAKNYKGSPLEQMLNNLEGLSIDKEETKASGADAALEALTETKKPETTTQDDLASLGL